MQRIRMIKAPIHCDWRFVMQSCWDYWVATSCLALTVSSFILIMGLLLAEHAMLVHSVLGLQSADIALFHFNAQSIRQGIDDSIFIWLVLLPIYFPAAKALGILVISIEEEGHAHDQPYMGILRDHHRRDHGR